MGHSSLHEKLLMFGIELIGIGTHQKGVIEYRPSDWVSTHGVGILDFLKIPEFTDLVAGIGSHGAESLGSS